MVSMSGEITLEKYLKFGWKILDRITVNSFERVIMVDKLKPVARIEIMTTIVNNRRIRGVLLRGLSTVCPFGSVMSSPCLLAFNFLFVILRSRNCLTVINFIKNFFCDLIGWTIINNMTRANTDNTSSVF